MAVFGGAAAGLDEGCLDCHGRPGLSVERGGRQVSLWVSAEGLRGSAHGRLTCGDCHEGYGRMPHPDEAVTTSCASCHPEARAALEASVHGTSIPKGSFACADCHGVHDVPPVGSPEGIASVGRMERTCGRCHPLPAGHPDEGPAVTPSCITCHGAHDVRGPEDESSPVSHRHVPETCGACHEKETHEYRTSVHGKALAAGVADAPSCTSCHGEHPLRVVGDPDSPVSAGNLPNTCSACHDAEEIVSRFDLPSNRLETYQDSYHGLANRYGQPVVANCASCHGAHRILSPDDPASSVHPANLPDTCGQCHPGAGTTFARGKVHVTATREDAPGVWIVRNFYIWFIGILVSLFLIYIVLDVYRHVRRRSRPQ
jgi:hypothetical protein